MDKTMLCYSCMGCSRLNDKGFSGTTNCNDYKPDKQNTFIDRICKEWEQKKIEKKNN
jgi:hypothetical protein